MTTADLAELREWTSRMLGRLGNAPALRIASPRDGLYSMRKKARDADVLLFTNTTTLWNAMGRNPAQPSGLIGPVKLR